MSYFSTLHFPEHYSDSHTHQDTMTDNNEGKRIDWHTMMMMQDPDENKHDTDDRTALDHDDSNKHFSLSELGKTPVMFDYDEPGDSRPDHHADGGWHNPMMYVDPEKDAPETYDSLPHWQWFDED